VHYHPGKANIVVDALSRKSYANEVQVMPMPRELCAKCEHLNLGFTTNAVELVLEPTLEQEIHKSQLKDAKLRQIAENIAKGKSSGFHKDDKVRYGLEKGCVCLRIRLSERQFCVKLMSQLIPYILGVLRCI
jgi:hypothetical protein